MEGLILRLMPVGKEFEMQELILQPHRIETSILDTAMLNSSLVYCDYEYSAQLQGVQSNSVTDLQLLLNGSDIDFSYAPDSGLITFGKSQKDRRIFSECYGYIQFTVILTDSGGVHLLETEYVQVMVKKSRRNNSVRRMTEYVCRKNASLLYGNKLTSKDSSGLRDNTSKTLETSILLLKQISRIFEENYRYFKANSRFVTAPEEHVDHFEKLQYVSTRTLQHIAHHPEELFRVPTSVGIKIGTNRYQPSKTLITSNVKSFDIYENQVLVGFLATVNRELERLSEEIEELIENIPQNPMEKNDYVTSSFFIYADTITSLRVILEDIKTLKRKCASLYSAYSKILPVKRINICDIPRFTPIFKSVPQYHQVYDCIVSWFTKGAFSLGEEKFMLSFLKISNLYEVYVLAKIINYFKEDGYTLQKAKRLKYNFNAPTLYVNTTCNNVYILKSDKTIVTVYYQPVVFNIDTLATSGIGLFRNTSISFNKAEEDVAHSGKYYTPDYLIKYEYEGRTGCDYVIADAKFSTVFTVKNKEVSKLAYKYLFSISSSNPEDKIIELCIFNGQSDYDNDGVTSIYDFSHKSHNILPQAEIVTLTENSEDNGNLHKTILRGTIGKYRLPDTISFTALPSPSNRGYEEIATSPVYTPKESAPKEQAAQPVSSETMPKQQPVSSGKKSKKAKEYADLLEIRVESIPLKNGLATQLIDAGYPTLRELVPNLDKKDLTNIPGINRGQRREIEANVNNALRKFRKKLK